MAASACAKLTPKLLGQIESVSPPFSRGGICLTARQQPDTPPEALVETLSILSILIIRFPSNLTSSTLEPHPLKVLAPLLSHPRPVVRKRAIVTLSQFIPISQEGLFSELLTAHVFPFLAPGANIDKQRTTVQLIAAVARNSPLAISSVLPEIVPGILKAIQRDDDELREGSLQVRISIPFAGRR